MEEEFWDCSVCTYKNKNEAFKCRLCDTRKGTSTRKPRVTATIVAQQIASSFPPIPPLPPFAKYQKTGPGGKRGKGRRSRYPRLRNVDRASGEDIEVTVDGVTVVITDYKLLSNPRKRDASDLSEPGSGDTSDTEAASLEEEGPGTPTS